MAKHETGRSARWQHAARTGLMLLLDAVLVALSLFIAQSVRWDFTLNIDTYDKVFRVAPVAVAICLSIFWLFGLYRSIWRYASIDTLFQIAAAALIGALLTYGYSLIRYALTSPNNDHLLARPVYLIFWLLMMVFIGGSRLLFRQFAMYKTPHHRRAGSAVRRVMVVGAGFAGQRTIKEMKSGRFGSYLPVLIVDDDPTRIGSRIAGVPVRGGTDKIAALAVSYAIDEIVVAIATPNGEIRPLMENCLQTGCRVKRISDSMQDVTNGGEKLRDIEINDLLGRNEERLDMTETAQYFIGKTVLITGGGGSIGAELCRQLMAMKPTRIVLYDISENYMYDLFFELQESLGYALDDKLILCVGSIRDKGRLDAVMAQYRPDVVLHAAAHKHVPLMEDCPDQAVKNNVFGTLNAAQSAVEHGVKRFVMISTDKAVNPTNVMGATKRVAEIIIEAMNGLGKTEFTAVRFGNVLGSHGSVVPLFERQIRAGGPITLTHPNIIRYFMTIPEAASLVLQAASIAEGGELFVLDMGQPVKILELAQRMIQLAVAQGVPPVKIVYTGLRPGEKLYEELLMDSEGITRTRKDKIFIAKPESVDKAQLDAILDTLRHCLDANGDMRACLHSVLPSYQEPSVVNDRAKAEHASEQAQPVAL